MAAKIRKCIDMAEDRIMGRFMSCRGQCLACYYKCCIYIIIFVIIYIIIYMVETRHA